MMYIMLAAVLYTAALLFGATASRNANTNLVSLLTNLVSIIVPLAVVLVHGLHKKDFTLHWHGIWTALVSGLLIGLYVLTLTKAFTENKVGIIAPMIYGVTIFASAILSYFLFKEKIGPLEGLGLGLVLIGIVVIAYARATSSAA